MKITLEANPADAPCCVKLIAEDGRELLIQTDWDYPAIAQAFGWDMSQVQCDHVSATFNRFTFDFPWEAVADCSHQGACDEDVSHWAKRIDRPESVTPELLRAELKEYGAWDDDELADDQANWERIIWIAARNLRDDRCKHEQTDGTVDCPECGLTASRFIQSAREWMDDNDGAEAEDPGYFAEGGAI